MPKGQPGTWDDRYTDPGAVIYYDGMFHMFRNGFREFPAESQMGYVTSSDGYTWIEQGEDPVGSRQFWFTNAVLKDDVIYLFVEGGIGQATQIYLATHEGSVGP